jgi:predicted metal-dependent hydrolase
MKYWCDNSPIWTHYGNASSILFPPWEKAFAHVITYYLPLVKDDALKTRMESFIKEEIAHANAHEAFNKRHGLIELQQQEELRVRAVYRKPQMQFWLGIMVSIEHMASCMARSVLKKWGNVQNKDYKVFCWHAKEELGHKSLAIDLWNHLGFTKKSLRKYALINQKYVMKFLICYTVKNTWQEKAFFKTKTWVDILIWLGYVCKSVFLPMLKIYLPNFHPNNYDDTQFLGATT